MKIKLKLVSDNFSKSACFYDEFAVFQKHSAEVFADKIKSHFPRKFSPGKILEIGCGTGLLTQRLVKLFPNAKFTITDFSEEMIKVCEKKFKGEEPLTIDFKICDIVNGLSGKTKYDFIVSGLTLQWIPKKILDRVIRNIQNHLGEKGIFAFSILADKTFPELRKTFTELGVPYPGPDFLSECEIRRFCSCFSKSEISSEIYSVNYPSTLKFLKNLQKTGAANATGKHLPAGKLKKIMEHHNKKYSNLSARQIGFEYHTVFCLCEK